MGGIFHLFDFNQGSMARKLLAHNRHVGGLDAPRNSLELQVQTSQGYCVGDMPYSHHMEEDRTAKSYYQTEVSMKKLISEEMSKQSNTRQNAPSIVARLMGMDALPLDTKSVVQPVEKKNDNQRLKYSKREKNEKGPAVHLSSNTNYSKQMDLDTIYSSKDRDSERWSTGQKFGKPRPREHPQEEELQKFKKEFEAWQAARLRECSKVVDVGSISAQQLAQERLNYEKMAAESERAVYKKPLEAKRFTVKENFKEMGLHHQRHKSELFTAEPKESRRQSMQKDFQLPSMMECNEKVDLAPTRIVILKPGPDRISDLEDSWTSSSGTFEERASIEDFLEEVRERLKMELQGKTLKKSSVVRGSGIETPFSEKPSDQRQLTKHIAKQVRDNFSRDLGMHLLRSESTRSYRSEIQLSGPDSPEFINKDTRRFLSERLRNVLKQETQLDVPIISSGSSKTYGIDNGRDRLKRIQDMSKSVNEHSYWEIVKDEEEKQARSFRHGDDVGPLNIETSPRNLIRSLSAPVSGTSFGKLLLEDRHILTGVQIRRKHEGIENVSVDVKKRKKEKFNLKEKVSNIKNGLTLRRRLFGKKIQAMVEIYGVENDSAKDILSGPTVVMNIGERHENPTEVPPSPASVCSSSHEELWRQVDYLSPISTPDVTLGEDDAVPMVFKEISSNLTELRRQLNELESDGADDIMVEQEPIEAEMVDPEDCREGYIRDLLVASGLYDGSCDKSLSRWDPFSKPVSNSVFEQVEESYRKLGKENYSSRSGEDEKVDHKVLLDLLNEALSTILGPPVTMSRFRRKVVGGSSSSTPARGRKLLKSVWGIIRTILYPRSDRWYYSLDSMVARDLGSTPWSGLMEEETHDLGREVECQIIGDLVEEIVKDMHALSSI